ncbi:uncharacterized protein NECHADRAFT_88471 [Fusarium vanettenii 77-13-4]|uniref:Uncharacterized protein n=1 Tax=Fusarium vanettenii (strain ATCC MYA-4622 / CBS 123669 / FGSC 9596 / NRRL 45880 / 77-13-4) TaxID=660122 RepID=C7ZBN2_FUSV7|nr:uncharacterized protein NECHADRAFT_88471 [Fusarium vanettenii 77-13-4]EEU38593.1 hypothetical protein NECHADRAFT_88471 [Fusarium vanettenii 77-13-4]
MPSAAATDPGASKCGKSRSRTFLRQWCRQTLATHINQQTSLSIQPHQVRLSKTEKYGYYWILENHSIEHLFSKSLSKLRMSDYRQLSQEVGHTFRAAPVSTTGLVHSHDSDPSQSSTEFYIPPYRNAGYVDSQQRGIGYSSDMLNHNMAAEEAESSRLRAELLNLSMQHEFAIQQLQDCRAQLQAAVEQKELCESFVLKTFLTMDDLGRMIEGLRDGGYRVLGGYNEAERSYGELPAQTSLFAETQGP